MFHFLNFNKKIMLLELVHDQMARLRLAKYETILRSLQTSGEIFYDASRAKEQDYYFDYLLLDLDRTEVAVFINGQSALRIVELGEVGIVYETMIFQKGIKIVLDDNMLKVWFKDGSTITFVYDREHAAWREVV